MRIELDMYQTMAVAVLALMLGRYLRKKCWLLERFCIPAPVIGGVIFAVATCICYVTGIAEFVFDDILKEVFMGVFLYLGRLSGKSEGSEKRRKIHDCFSGTDNRSDRAAERTAIGLAKLLHLDPLVGMCTGSIPMTGGHGTAGAFGPVLEDFGISGATTVCTAAATFGLVAGSVMGGPLGERLVEKRNLLKTAIPEDDSLLLEEDKKHERHVKQYPAAFFQLVLAMGIGTVLSQVLSMTGMTFPIYIGAMIVAAVLRNLSEYTGKFPIYMGEINGIGGISLSMFLGLAMITLKLWQLAELAVPMLLLLTGQVLLMFLYTYFVVFSVMGKDYDAAVICSGTCGFGMGATPNAMANMQAVCEKYVPSVKAYLLIPIVGSLFADFINSLVITLLINFL